MSPNASHRVRPGLSSAASLITPLLISFDQEVLNQHLNLVTPEYPFFESPWELGRLPSTSDVEKPTSQDPRRRRGDDVSHSCVGEPSRAGRAAAVGHSHDQ